MFDLIHFFISIGIGLCSNLSIHTRDQSILAFADTVIMFKERQQNDYCANTSKICVINNVLRSFISVTGSNKLVYIEFIANYSLLCNNKNTNNNQGGKTLDYKQARLLFEMYFK